MPRSADRPGAGWACCVDVGSTFTKGVAVSLDDGQVLGTATTPTTAATDVLEGLDEVAAGLRSGLGPERELLVCSSAGGGLRLAVVGHEAEVTARAGHRVGLSAGAAVVHVSSGRLDGAGVAALRAARPDVLLVVGGTDGGNSQVLRHNVSRLATARVRTPVVLAGNAAATDELAEVLRLAGRDVVTAPNVLPRIGVLEPAGARAAIREVFLRHVIGGKGLSRGPRFGALVRAATPDAVISGVECLADGHPDDGPGAGDVLVVDVGGATTDVYSVVAPQGEDATRRRDVVATLWRARTVEGDLGMRWGARGVVDAARAEGLLDAAEADRLAVAADHRVAHPALVPGTPGETAEDVRLATLAVTVGLRRHARPEPGAALGRDLRRVRVVVGSGGVLRHADRAARDVVLAAATGDHGGGWRVPSAATVVVDTGAVLAAAGLLAAAHPAAAARLAARVLVP